jgi:hypothetical protein
MALKGSRWVSRAGGLLIAIATLGLVLADTPAVRADGAWLDAPLQNWNQPNQPVPTAPAVQNEPSNPQCLNTVRAPETDEDRAVAAAGWKLVGTFQGGFGAMVVTATTDFDGMCRPNGFQVFVFYHENFIGTVSPDLMVSRTDGSLQRVFLSASITASQPPGLNADFSRYTEQDPLCCPSRVSSVNYSIEFISGGWVLVPTSVSTSPTGSS